MSSDPITRLNEALEGRYSIERELGQGGMATVYLTKDLRHQRHVALKVLKPELAAVIGAERFLAEIKTTANLQHPHILPLHDSGEADGYLFYVMPYVGGESLRDRLDREGQLPIDEAVAIASAIARALQHAHDRSVIHRDIKPGNILLQDGQPVVSDFGIALAVGSSGGPRLTETGLSVGTPHYMSPEQATGDQHVGPATDLYALGCVLYEMLVGEPPFTGRTAQAVLGKIVLGDPEPPSVHRASTPRNVEAAVLKALAKTAADRFASASRFSEALNDPSFRTPFLAGRSARSAGYVWPAAFVVCVAVAWLLLQIADTLGPTLHLPDWVISAVAFLLILGLPVALVLAWAFDLTPEGIKPDSQAEAGEPGSEARASKLGPAVITALVLAVGYFAFDKFVLRTDGETQEHPIAAEVGGEATDTGSAQPPVEDRARAQAAARAPDNSIAVLPFINMSSDEEQEYFSDGLAEELLNLLSRIPEVQVAARTSSFAFKDTNMGVTEIAERLNVAHVLEGSVRKQGDQLRITTQLVQADNGFQLWSETYDRRLDNVFQIQEDIARSVVDALRINLLGEAPTVRTADPAAYQLFLEGQYLKRQISGDALHRAIEAFEQSVAIDPGYAPAWAEMADTYMWIGGSERYPRGFVTERSDEAVQAAIRNDPDYAYAYYVRGIFRCFRTMQFQECLEDFEHALELEPDNPVLVAAIGKGAYLTGDFDLAIAQYEKALAVDPVFPEFHWFLGRTYLSAGRFDEAEATFRKLLDLSPDSYGNDDLWEVLYLKGELEAALALASDSFRRSVTHYALGNREASDEALTELTEFGSRYQAALAFGYLNDADKTFEWLERVMEAPDRVPTFILTEHAFRSVHDDERWLALMERLDLSEYWQAMARAR